MSHFGLLIKHIYSWLLSNSTKHPYKVYWSEYIKKMWTSMVFAPIVFGKYRTEKIKQYKNNKIVWWTSLYRYHLWFKTCAINIIRLFMLCHVLYELTWCFSNDKWPILLCFKGCKTLSCKHLTSANGLWQDQSTLRGPYDW